MKGMDRTTGKALTGLAHVRQSIHDILTTPMGSRVMRESYGSRLFALIDQPMTHAFALPLYAATVEAIARWEPRFLLKQVQLISQTAGSVTLALRGVVKNGDFRANTLDQKFEVVLQR